MLLGRQHPRLVLSLGPEPAARPGGGGHLADWAIAGKGGSYQSAPDSMAPNTSVHPGPEGCLSGPPWPLRYCPRCLLLPDQVLGRPQPPHLDHTHSRPWGSPKTSLKITSLSFSALVTSPSDRSHPLPGGSLLWDRPRAGLAFSLGYHSPAPHAPSRRVVPALPLPIALPRPEALLGSHRGLCVLQSACNNTSP